MRAAQEFAFERDWKFLRHYEIDVSVFKRTQPESSAYPYRLFCTSVIEDMRLPMLQIVKVSRRSECGRYVSAGEKFEMG
jgi:hypothetical protein